MTQNQGDGLLGTIGGLILGGAVAFFPAPGLAQLNLIPDSSLGTTVQPRSPQVDVVTGGTPSQNGANLFHSFTEFNVNTGRSVLFANPSGVRNILSRVTGSDPSDILGTLGVEGPANLFLLNPNGIIFGSGARLNISGAFVATTANEIEFGNQGSFSALTTAGTNPALLTIDPSALLFSQQFSQASPISVERTANSQVTLSNPGQSVLLVGGAINFNRANLNADGGRIELGAVSGPTRVGLERDASGNDLRLNIPDNAARADILINRSNLSVTASNGGNIALYGKNVKISNSQVAAGIADGQGSINSRGGDILLNATSLLTLDGNSEISSEVGRTSIGSGGNIVVEADAVSMTGRRTQIRTVTSSQQPDCFNHPCNAGNIIVRARTLNITNPPQLTGDGAGLQANTQGIGNGGDITVNVRESVSLSNRGRIESEVKEPDQNRVFVVGNAGNIQISAHTLSLFNAGRITAGSEGTGSAGDISVTADSVSLSRSGRMTSNIDNGNQTLPGNSREGNIIINARTVSLTDGGFIQANTNAASNGGTIRINASESVSLAGLDRDRQFRSSISAAASSEATGHGGNTLINTGTLSVLDGAVVSARTESSSTGGNITINANRVELLSGGQIVTTAYSSGNAGNITVNAADRVLLSGNDPDFDADILEALRRLRLGIIPSIDLVIVTDGSPSGLFARTIRASGSAGNLNINAPLLQVENGAQVAASTLPVTSGQGGNITIRGDRLILQHAGELTVSSEGTGRAGNLEITVPTIQLNDRARIGAGTIASSGGNIRLNGVRSLQVNNSEIAASTVDGEGGSLDIQAAGGTVLLNGPNGLSVEATGRGSAGNLTVIARTVTVQNGARIAASNVSSTTPNVGNIRLADLDVLRVNTNGQISASTQSGQAGSVFINARNAVELNRSGQLSVGATRGGSAGNLRIETDRFTAQTNSRATVSSTGSGTAGALVMSARTVWLNNRAALTAETEAGRGGNIQLQIANALRLQNDSLISASTQSGIGGDVNLNGLNSLELNNSRITASTVSGTGGSLRINANGGQIALSDTGELSAGASGSGSAGNLFITARRLSVQRGAQVSVRSEQGRAGNLTVQASAIALNRGTLTAETATSGEGQGANIRLLGLNQLLMRDRSRISAQASNNANGGNIDIDASQGFLVAIPAENSDIIARANRGTGGNINITTQGIFGLVPITGSLVPLSEINASSAFGINGEIIINTPDVDPSRGLVELPTDVGDASRLIAQGCSGRGGAIANRQQSEFVLTGRGGLPISPEEPLNPNAVLSNWVALNHSPESSGAVTSTGFPVSEPSIESSPAPIIEAQGWQVNPDGQVLLAAYANSVTPSQPGLIPVSCPVP
ncbi:MAG TPA: filamentous hemagglutinin N-terminal domain-containing protein [Crinalium sp.]|jgi:filamentous hemagglutinin family protein